MTNKETARARWVADLAITYGARLTDGDRLKLLGQFYDVARSHGVEDGIDRMHEAAQQVVRVVGVTP